MINLNLDLNKIRQFYYDHDKTVRMAALILVVGLSILFFWIRGSGGTVEIQDADGVITDEISESEDLSEEDGTESETPETSLSGFIYVDISGEVHKPGVYKVTADTRLFEVIDMAGGLTPDADDNSLNRAERVSDGQKVIVISKEEAEGRDNSGESVSSFSTDKEEEEKINLNTAGSAELQTLPGIGPSKAQSIIDYREKNGYFTSTEDILNISGIGQKTYASIKDFIVI